MRLLFRCWIGAIILLLAIGGTQADTIRLGAILPLTGPGARIGSQQMRGLQFAIDQANAAGGVHGDAIEILFQDDQGKSDLSILSFNALVDVHKVPMIFCANINPCLAMAGLATGRKVLLANANAQADKLATASPYLINMLPAIGDEVNMLSRYLIGEGKTRSSILFKNDAEGIAGRDGFVKYFPRAGGTVLSQEATGFGQTDYRPALLKLADAKPDVMLLSITAGLIPMFQQYRRFGLPFTIAGPASSADPDSIANLATEGFIHTQMRSRVPPELVAAFTAKFDMDMGFPVRQYYNAAQIILAVTERLLVETKPITGETMRDMLFTIGRFQGLIPLMFETNVAAVPLDIAVVTGGKNVTIKPMNAD